ncbi:MAG: glycosyltransferase [Ferruginibacter sp.]|nr:glycosyltransferase [Ferruginibacter sp.]
MQADIAIIVVAYNRPQALSRLLSSLHAADYSGFANIPLIISIDYSGDDKCEAIARQFEWKHGHKNIIAHTQNLGLKKHILQCGDMALQHDGVIVLEDDLFVSPAFYHYAHQAYRFYKEDETIAGIGLYNYPFNEIAFCPFEPIADGYDNYFMQVPCSWGQLWTKAQWQKFSQYLQVDTKPTNKLLPAAVQSWPSASSWKKLFYQYLIEHNLYFVYPRKSLTTNYGDIGQHHPMEMMVWQTPLLINTMPFRFSTLETAIAVFDAYFELSAKVFNRITNAKLDICIDLYGSKPLVEINNAFLLSSKKCNAPLKKYGFNLYPYINNALLGLDNNTLNSNYFSLGPTASFAEEPGTEIRAIEINRVFYNNNLLVATGRNEVYRTKEFKIGHNLLKPLRWLNRLFKLQ